MENIYKKLGVHIPEILLPAHGTDLGKWSVIACDQYTSQPEYWKKVTDVVGDSPSTLRLTFPEIYLKDDDKEERIIKINQTMDQYIEQGILETQKPGFILVDRSTPHTPSRKGLVMAVDLECYDYTPGSQALIRATEGTVLDRIPPRVKIRENAPIELPHIMILIDDPEKTVIEGLFEKTNSGGNVGEGVFRKLYDFELMQNGGHIRGWKVEDKESLTTVANALGTLAGPTEETKADGMENGAADVDLTDAGGQSPCKAPLLFAVGDGNHSLASAKAHWENVKAALKAQEQTGEGASSAAGSDGRAAGTQQTPVAEMPAAETLFNSQSTFIPDHPARYALVEVVNVHDDGLVFEPIHRVVFGVDCNKVLEEIKSAYYHSTSKQSTIEYKLYDSRAVMEGELKATVATNTPAADQASPTPKDSHLLPFIMEGTYGLLTVTNPASSLEVGTLQSILDTLAKNKAEFEIDYIHGEQVVTELGSQKNCMGFYLPVMDKHDLFKTVKHDGVLPRKTFSMGEAEEKRYYLECRRIR